MPIFLHSQIGHHLRIYEEKNETPAGYSIFANPSPHIHEYTLDT